MVKELLKKLLTLILFSQMEYWSTRSQLINVILLSSLDAPDIATIPVSTEQYAFELPKLTHLQLEQISNPKTLNDDQRFFIMLHYKMNHLPLPSGVALCPLLP
jgi:hypothetical protein